MNTFIVLFMFGFSFIASLFLLFVPGEWAEADQAQDHIMFIMKVTEFKL